MTYQIVYNYVDPYDASFDSDGATEITADNEDQAIEKFREDYGDSYNIQCCFVVKN